MKKNQIMTTKFRPHHSIHQQHLRQETPYRNIPPTKCVTINFITLLGICVIVFGLQSLRPSVLLSTNTMKQTKTENPLNLETIVREISNPICQASIQSLLKEKIRLVAIDFDMTIIDIHTGGRWEGNVDQLSKHVRPEFQCVIESCLTLGIFVAIATFSAQKELIDGVIQTVTKTKNARSVFGISRTQRTIPIFGLHDTVQGFSKGKQSQLFMAMQHFNAMEFATKDLMIAPDSTLLIDDDKVNIRIAQRDRYRTILYDPENSNSLNAIRCCTVVSFFH